jgi:cytochrome c556
MRIFWWLLATGLSLLVGTAVHAQPARKPAASPATPATVKQLMEAIESASNVVYSIAVEAPKTNEDWIKVEQNAIRLTESGNRLMTGTYTKGRKRDWIKWSRALVAASLKASNAARKKNLDGVLGAGDEINISCEACHARYLETPRHLAGISNASRLGYARRPGPSLGVSCKQRGSRIGQRPRGECHSTAAAAAVIRRQLGCDWLPRFHALRLPSC